VTETGGGEIVPYRDCFDRATLPSQHGLLQLG
jgi:hypothetical protein